MQGRRNVWGHKDWSSPCFQDSVNPISTRGADYAHHSTTVLTMLKYVPAALLVLLLAPPLKKATDASVTNQVPRYKSNGFRSFFGKRHFEINWPLVLTFIFFGSSESPFSSNKKFLSCQLLKHFCLHQHSH